jgi:hypothetical protein
MPWIVILLLAGLVTRIPHILLFNSPSSETELIYFPTLGAARFEQCARALINGTVAEDAFAFASPVYILLLVPLYAVGITNTLIFILQTLMGIATVFLIYSISLKAGASKWLATAGAVLWTLYAPSAFYETTLLPIALLSLLISFWALNQFHSYSDGKTSLLTGFLSGIITGLRPPFILLGFVSLWQTLRNKRYLHAVLMLSGFLVPILILSIYHLSQGGEFTPFASSLGLNLVQGHAESATGYGPPIPEYGLIENPSENIHEVGARIAAENGYTSPSEADKFWLEKAVNWILNNPGDEFRLLGAKLGAFLGYKPFDEYFDLQRDIRNDTSLKHLILPRYILIAFIVTGIVPFLLFGNSIKTLAVPVLVSLITILAFCHSERYLLPVLPVTAAISGAGLQLLFHTIKNKHWKRASIAVLSAAALMIPGALWPVPDIPESVYFYNRAAKAYNMGNYPLALLLFEESASVSPRVTTVSINSRVEALRISRALGLEDRVQLHSRILQQETQRADSVNRLPDN